MRKILIGVAACLLVAAPAAADAPAFLPVQGVLANTDGTPVDGDTAIRFALYTADVGGTELWNETQTVSVDQGFFTVYLGDTSVLDLATFRDNESLWLGVRVGSDPEMTRFQVATTGFAGFAQFCGDSATLGGTPATDFLTTASGVDWSDLTGVPADLADGDSDTTYTAGAGLTLTGTVFAADPAAIEALARGVCYDTVAELRAGLDSVYAAASHDHDAAYVNVGEVDSITSAMIVNGSVGVADINTAQVQARITGCAAGSYMQTVAADGAATCAPDLNASTPAGVVSAFAGAAAPTGYLLCDGAAVSRATYSTLFATLGTTYGAGDGSTTFNLPDLDGRVPVGRDAAQPVFAALNNRGGEITHTLTVAELAGHTHTGTTVAAGDHAHTGTTSADGAHTPAGTIAGGDHAHTASETTAGAFTPAGTVASAGDHAHTLTMTGAGTSPLTFLGGTTSPGSGTTGPYAIPFIRNADGVNYNDGVYDDMVFYNASNAQYWNRDTDWISISWGGGNATTTTGAHTHAFTGTAVAAHSHTLTVNSAGHAHTFTGTAVAAHS
jgi:microcystin-dependent protein